MPFIRTVPDEEATGRLRRIFEGSKQRAGRVFNIVRVQSLNPRTLQAGIGLYQAAVIDDSPLTRAQREMIAVVVSKVNGCHY